MLNLYTFSNSMHILISLVGPFFFFEMYFMLNHIMYYCLEKKEESHA